MISARKIRIAAIAAVGLSAAALATNVTEAGAASPCAIVDADVESGTAMFTVGPADCTGQVGPVSFSTYALPSGQIEPYADQVLIAHSDANGRFYGAGTYTLTASLGDALNWQSDLYLGDSDNRPPHPNNFAADAQTGVTSVTQTTVASGPSVQAVTGSQVQSLPPTPTQNDGGTLPLTGSAPTRVLMIAAGMMATGFAMRRFVRMPVSETARGV
ncbi:MAG TPA: hypothetical protein VE487_13155 [Ilumatobacter sp.]|nr:hypothetical protein [Ilumatobacter sp.]